MPEQPSVNIYRDTDDRMMRDPKFNAAVALLEKLAYEHGFTPGELQQIAFAAALRVEMIALRQYSALLAHREEP